MAKTTIRKKKVKRSFTRGVAHIHATFNTLLSITQSSQSVMNKVTP